MRADQNYTFTERSRTEGLWYYGPDSIYDPGDFYWLVGGETQPVQSPYRIGEMLQMARKGSILMLHDPLFDYGL